MDKLRNKKREELLNTFKDNKVGNNSKNKKKLFSFVLIFLVIFIAANIIHDNSKEQQRQEALKIEAEQREKEREEAIQREENFTLEEKLDNIKSKYKEIYYDKETKRVCVTLEFKSNLGNANGISMANQSVYDLVKEIDVKYSEEVKEYAFYFEHKMVDKYGNTSYSPVYTLSLTRNELDKVNWEGINSSMLVGLSTNAYKNQELNN